MNRRSIRNGVLLAFAAISASLEAPRLSHESLGGATAVLTAGPTAIGTAIGTVATAVRASHLGFDTNIYPGDEAMAAWRQSGEYEWVGYYLQGACHSDGSWSGTRERLTKSGWGLAVIYVGQQTWGANLNAVATRKTTPTKTRRSSRSRHRTVRTMARKSTVPVATASEGCSAKYVDAAQGRIDARDAIAKTAHEGFPSGTVIFLDLEHMNAVPQRMRDYYRAWTGAVLADGRYRPGIYAHTKNAATIYDDVSDVFADAGAQGEPAFWIAGSSGFSTDSDPTDVGHDFATAWQGVLDVVRTHNGVKLPVDISVASVASPSSVQ